MALEKKVKFTSTKDGYLVSGPGIALKFENELAGPKSALELKKHAIQQRIPTAYEYALLMKAALASGRSALHIVENFYVTSFLTDTVLFGSAYNGKEVVVAIDTLALKADKNVLPKGIVLKDILAAPAEQTWTTRQPGVGQSRITRQESFPARVIWDLARSTANAGRYQAMAHPVALLYAIFNGPDGVQAYQALGNKRLALDKGFSNPSISAYAKFLNDKDIQSRGIPYLALGSLSGRCHVYTALGPNSKVSARFLKS